MQIERKRKDELEGLKSQFEQTIKNLRLVKFPKSLIRELHRGGILNSSNKHVDTIFALSKELPKENSQKIPPNRFMMEDIFLIVDEQVETDFLEKEVITVISRPPLSKFGIESRIVLKDRDEFISDHRKALVNLEMWLYSFGVVHKFERKITFSDWIYESNRPLWKTYLKSTVPPIISNVGVKQEVPKSWESSEKKHCDSMNRHKELFGIT